MVEFSYLASAALGTLTVVVAAVYLLLGIDDLVFDLFYWGRKIGRAFQRHRFPKLTIEKLRMKPEQRIAILIPCWHEANVVERMLDFAASSLEYQRYDIFVGVYPNDPETVETVQSVAARRPNIKCVINPLPGPTTKAQNLNVMFTELERVEGREPYEIVVLHDTEDVIHPLSLKMYNYLMPQREMIQLPVLPLERPMFEWTSWTYADEFAENHQKDMVVREAIGSFVPSAGVGCAFSRAALEIISVTADDVFPSHTLTEDYQAGLRLRLRGLSTIFVFQQLARRRGEPFVSAASYIATRSYFPDSLRTAVRQKARWVVGICFEAWQSTGWVGNFAMRYALYRDRKSVVSNVFSLFGYTVVGSVLLMFGWHALNSRIVIPHVPNDRLVLAMLDFVLALTLWRLAQKAYFVAALYGPVQGLLSVVRPPWGALINGLATLRAIGLFTNAIRDKKTVVWNKTDHNFPTDAILAEFRRQLGTVLVEQNKISETELAQALDEKAHDERLGDALVRLGFVRERDIIEAVADQTGASTAVDDDLIPTPEALTLLPFVVAEDNCWLPLRVEGSTLYLAVVNLPNSDEMDVLRQLSHHRVEAQLVEPGRVTAAIRRAYHFGDADRAKPIGVYLIDKGLIDRSTLDRYLAERDPAGRRLLERLADDGVFSDDELANVVHGYFDVPILPADNDFAEADDADVLRIADILQAHPGLALVSRFGSLTVFSDIPTDASIVESVHARLGAVPFMVVRRSKMLEARASIDERIRQKTRA